MTQDDVYRVGRGRPPLHTRFKKGQSGNPSGRPGPLKLLEQRFNGALCKMLEGSVEDLERMEPPSALLAMARRMALDAVAGRAQALRLLLKAIDKGGGEGEDETITVVHENGEGNLQIRMEDLLGLFEEARTEARHEMNAAWAASLQQGKKQGNAPADGAGSVEPLRADVADDEPGNGAGPALPVSQVQGKTQGKAASEERASSGDGLPEASELVAAVPWRDQRGFAAPGGPMI